MWLAMSLLLVATPAEVPETYTVQDGDTCPSITRRFFGPDARVDALHRLNALGAPPHRLVAGQVLRLREAQTQPDATLTFLKPAVRTRTHDVWSPARLGMGLFRLDEVNTMRRASAELTLRDESQLLLDENALVVIYGETDLRRPQRGPALIEGELRLALTNARTLEIGGASVKGGRANGVASVDDARASRVSIFDGEVVVEAQQVAVTLKQDQGTLVRPGAPPLPARALPAPPRPEPLSRVVLTGTSGVAQADVRWGPVAGATRYRVQVARDAKFLDLAADLSGDATAAAAGPLARGRYFLRVIAYDADGLQGRGSVPQSFDVATLGSGADGRGVVQLLPGQRPAFEGPPGTSLAWPEQGLRAGRHELEIRGGDGAIVGKAVVSVRPGAPTPRVQQDRLVLEFGVAVGSDELLSVTDARGRLPMQRRSETAFESTRAPVGSTTVSWDGFDLLRFDR